MVYFQKMTPEGYKQIEDEIARLKKGRPRRIKILQAARALGDLSENTEYTEAKRYLGKQLHLSFQECSAAVLTCLSVTL